MLNAVILRSLPCRTTRNLSLSQLLAKKNASPLGKKDRPRRLTPMRFAVTLLILGTLLASAPLSAQASSPAHAQPVGVPFTTIIVFGNQYDGGDELYDARITVLEIVGGPKAWDIIKRASASNAPPKPGFEYLLARVGFGFSARTSPHHYNYTLRQDQFTAMSAAGNEYVSPALAAKPSPPLSGTLRSGDSVEGWLAFEVPQSDRRPFMVFREDVGSVFHEGGSCYFKLYREK
jgi:hypothetical protein